MSEMRKLALWILLFLTVSPMHGQQARSGAATAASAEPAAVAAPAALSAAPPPNKFDLTIEDPALKDALTKWLLSEASRPPVAPSVDVKLLEPALQKAISERLKEETEKKDREGWARLLDDNPALWGVLGVVLGGLITGGLNYLGLRETLKKQEKREKAMEDLRSENELKRDEAAARFKLQSDQFQATHSGQQTKDLETLRAEFSKWEVIGKIRLERLEKFHAPLRALNQQSSGVADKLYHQIYASKDSDLWDRRPLAFMTKEEAERKYVPSDAELADAKAPRRRVYIYHKDQWRILRMLDFMPVLLKNESTRQLTSIIIEIGREMTGVIKTHGGLAAAGQNPPPIFGQYLAHFAILEQLFKNPPKEPFEPGSQKVGYYPMEFDEIVEKGYDQARTDVAEYEKS